MGRELIVDRICKKVSRGAKLFATSEHHGKRRVKLVRGPFGLLTEKMEISEQDWRQVKARLDSGDWANTNKFAARS